MELEVYSGRNGGVIPADKISKLKNSIREGVIYTIPRYLILRAKGKYRATDHPIRLSFISKNNVCPFNPQPTGFPLIAHNALPFSILEKRIGSNVLMSGLFIHRFI